MHFYDDNDAWELYDLENDPNELDNLIDSPEHQDLVIELKLKMYLKSHYRNPGII